MNANALMLAVVPTLARWLLWSFGKLSRVHVVGAEHVEALETAGRRYIFIVWHGKLFLPVYHHRGRGITAIVSRHRDGELIARTIAGLGYRTVRGSSTRGGTEAYYQMSQFLKGTGPPGAVMPDGPRGPARRFKPGAVYLARQSGASLVPLSFAASRRLTFGTWDSFTVQLPFSRCVLAYGEPVEVPPDADETLLERLRAVCEENLEATDRLAEDRVRKGRLP